MRKVKLFFNLILLISFLSACANVSDIPKILRNEKIKTTDEFLVKKREPLTEPPEVRTLPTPKSSSEEKIANEEEGIKSILKTGDEEKDKTQSKISSVEDLIIDQIRQ